VRTAALLLLLATLLPAGPVAAQCLNAFVPGSSEDGRVTPSSSNSPVPINTWVWYLVVNPATSIADTTAGLELISLETGAEIALEGVGTVRSDDRVLLAYRPEVELEPLTDYEISFDREPGLVTNVTRVGFRTSDQRDTEAPAVPELLGQELFTDYNQLGSEPCRVTDYHDEVSFFLGSDGYFNLLADDVEVDSIDDLFTDVVAISESAEVSWTGDIGPNQQLSFRHSTVDLAGNFSGWSETVEVTMPAPGCVGTGDGRVSQASLILAALLLLVRRKRRPHRGHFAVFGLVAALMLPTAARADSPPLITGEEEVEEVAPAPPAPEVDWKLDFGKELALHTRGWGIATAGTGLLQASFLLMQPARVPFALQLSIANTMLWMPSLSTLVVMAGTSLVLRSTTDAYRLARGLRRASNFFGILSLALLQASIPLAVYGGTFDPSIAVSVLGVHASVIFVALATAVLSKRVEAHSYLGERDRRRAQVFPLPTGILVLF